MTEHTDQIAASSEPDYRFLLANERTFLAWQRTALGLLAAAAAVVQLGPELGVSGARHLFGVLLATLAVLAAGAGEYRRRRVDRALRTGTALPRPHAPGFLAAGLIVLGLLTAVALAGQLIAG